MPKDLFQEFREAIEGLPLVAKSYLGAGAVESDLREKVMVEVSAINDCQYCLTIHGALADLEGVNDTQREALQSTCQSPMLLDVDARTRLALEVSKRRVLGESLTDIEELVKETFTPEELNEIAAFTQVMVFSNTAGNTLDRVLGRGKSEKLLEDLAFLALLSPVALPFLGLYGLSKGYLRLGG